MKAVVLLSGGIDSSTTLAIAREMDCDLFALTLLYGQTHEKEVDSARKVADSVGVSEHRILRLPEGIFSGSALTGNGKIPLDRELEKESNITVIPETYVPARNLVFLSMASSWAESLGAEAVFIGVTAVDYSGYPDCRPEFISSFQKTMNLATKRGIEGDPIRIVAPLIELTKDRIILKGTELGLDYGLTWSCYTGGEKACGRCDSCLFRLKGFKEARLKDPIEYE